MASQYVTRSSYKTFIFSSKLLNVFRYRNIAAGVCRSLNLYYPSIKSNNHFSEFQGFNRIVYSFVAARAHLISKAKMQKSPTSASLADDEFDRSEIDYKRKISDDKETGRYIIRVLSLFKYLRPFFNNVHQRFDSLADILEMLNLL